VIGNLQHPEKEEVIISLVRTFGGQPFSVHDARNEGISIPGGWLLYFRNRKFLIKESRKCVRISKTKWSYVTRYIIPSSIRHEVEKRTGAV